jgi:hypothetical protein
MQMFLQPLPSPNLILRKHFILIFQFYYIVIFKLQVY